MEIVNTVALASQPAMAPALVEPHAVAPAPDAMAAARFAQVMATPPASPTAAVQNVPAAHAPRASDEVRLQADASMGDRILHGMNRLSTDFRQSVETVNTSLSVPDDKLLQVKDMLQLQMHVVHMTYQFDLVGKVVSRSTQNIDQLVRMQ